MLLFIPLLFAAEYACFSPDVDNSAKLAAATNTIHVPISLRLVPARVHTSARIVRENVSPLFRAVFGDKQDGRKLMKASANGRRICPCGDGGQDAMLRRRR